MLGFRSILGFKITLTQPKDLDWFTQNTGHGHDSFSVFEALGLHFHHNAHKLYRSGVLILPKQCNKKSWLLWTVIRP